MPSPLTSALAAALAAGAVMTVTAMGESGDRPHRAGAARTAPVLIAPTRAQAIDAAASFRDRVNAALAGRLRVAADRLLGAERAIVARQLGEAVDHRFLSAAQRDALLACFDDPKACNRGELPVLHGGLPPGGIPLPIPPIPPRRGHVVPFPAPADRLHSGRVCAPVRRRSGRRPAPLRCRHVLPAGPAAELAKQLSLPRKRVEAALRGTLRALRDELGSRRGPPADPDGVPLGVPLLMTPFPVAAFVPVLP